MERYQGGRITKEKVAPPPPPPDEYVLRMSEDEFNDLLEIAQFDSTVPQTVVNTRSRSSNILGRPNQPSVQSMGQTLLRIKRACNSIIDEG